MDISELRDKRILILGFGLEGQDSFLFLRKKFPEKSLGVADAKEFEELPREAQNLVDKDNKVVLYFGAGYTRQLHAYDVIIKSPGVPARVVQPLLKKHQVLTSQTNIFFANCPGTIVGITGTKGKSTTASLIYEVLKVAKKNVFLVGNIEQPVLQFLDTATKDSVYVYELSSAQLEIANKSPRVAVFLNLYPEHLDHHKTFKAYAAAKANITKFQTAQDYFIFNEQSEEIAAVAKRTKAQLVAYKPKKGQGSAFITPVQPVLAVAKLFGIPKEKALAAIKKFKPLPHRLQPIGAYKGILFYNDSLATIPQATAAAIETLGNKVHTLIAGGFNRGVSQEPLAKAICQSNIQTLVLFPETGKILWKDIERQDPSPKLRHFFAHSMQEAVQTCFKNTPRKKICLLSPAASSFHMFKDYKDRGEQFQKAVTTYGKKTRA